MLLIAITMLSMFANYPTLTREGVSGSATKAIFAFFTSVVLFMLVASTIKTFDEATADREDARDRRGNRRPRGDLRSTTTTTCSTISTSGCRSSSRPAADRPDAQRPLCGPGVVAAPDRARLRAHDVRAARALLRASGGDEDALVLWTLCGVFAIVGAFVTLSRTVTIVLAAMALAGLWVRRDLMMKLWPVFFLLPGVIHFAAPGVLGTIVHSFNPYGGLSTAESQRAGLVGSGRLADINPGLHMFAKSPVFGIGIGALNPTGAAAQQASPIGVVSLSAPASGSGRSRASQARPPRRLPATDDPRSSSTIST